MANKKNGSIIHINPKEVYLKRKIRSHLSLLGFTRDGDGGLQPPGTSKDIIRELHASQRKQIIVHNSEFLVKNYSKLEKYFANGSEVDVNNIKPRLERIDGNTWQSELFKLASLTWSVPVSSGFGRRLRFLVWDDHNGKLIGLIAIGDPVFNLSARDNFIGWEGKDRSERLVNVMDAYVLGAIPPYNMLLGGKLVACLVRSAEIYNEFSKKYGSSVGIISNRQKQAKLLAVTTSSSMGKSSVYNRLKIEGIDFFERIGFSTGWGHFHVPDDLFLELRNYLRMIDHRYADLHSFGQGSNWRIRTIKAALQALGFRGTTLKHGIRREVFISLLAENSIDLLRGGTGSPKLNSLKTVAEISSLAADRWLIARAHNQPTYKQWSAEMMKNQIELGKPREEINHSDISCLL